MNQIDAALKHFKEWHPNMGLKYLWFTCDGEMDEENYPDIKFEYDPDTAFFKALKILLDSEDKCLFYNLNSEDPSRDGEHLTCSPEEQFALLKKVWVGKEEMDKMDEENGYLGWYFLILCPYSLAHKIYDENGNFIKWWHAE
ncbi:hypothetical protein [Acinetobacter sp. MD2]|uniref:hypothetical protein n=1 Tax=Acinetobacter sp. MD2 TaxID=2600066 RepID=UPI002D1EFA6D|nr:hypothetical protein [Acinetobacter sp. MD2]MEB3768403.1 hypothetical protein [Acinetobacter sp. MD2]